MLQTRKITEDAFTIRELKEGETYDVTNLAAWYAIHHGWAVRKDNKQIYVTQTGG